MEVSETGILHRIAHVLGGRNLLAGGAGLAVPDYYL